ncbi:hypothetical protein RB628_38360 [Streptomyces sp. ADMS]|uniref:hypothetical protein n=1 Tax=Streptomyces sp. ADMS TaxID=3071415 RepID=UPI00296E67EC|nr:hypothetical protein [Streptomyces sp. ADMS]MDW4911026.1 hypothetical protein [Streptomyces sp. ADMS]
MPTSRVTAGWVLALVAVLSAAVALAAPPRTAMSEHGGPPAPERVEQARLSWQRTLLDRGMVPHLRRHVAAGPFPGTAEASPPVMRTRPHRPPRPPALPKGQHPASGLSELAVVLIVGTAVLAAKKLPSCAATTSPPALQRITEIVHEAAGGWARRLPPVRVGAGHHAPPQGVSSEEKLPARLTGADRRL